MPIPFIFISPKKIRDDLWAKDPHCHWCGRLTVPPSQVKMEPRQPNPPDMATLDHLVDRFDGRNTGNVTDAVLACNECNNRRGRERQAAVPLEELQRRSKMHDQARCRRHYHNQEEWDKAIGRFKAEKVETHKIDG